MGASAALVPDDGYRLPLGEPAAGREQLLEPARLLQGAGDSAERDWRRDASGRLRPTAPYPGVSYRPYLESGALRQMRGLPEQAFETLVTLLIRICDGPYDPKSQPPGRAWLMDRCTTKVSIPK
jgi:hypothetical protein